MAIAVLVDKRNQNGTSWIKKDRSSRLRSGVNSAACAAHPSVRHRGLLVFFVAAFTLAWLSFGLAILAGKERMALPPILFVTAGVLGPLFGAIGAVAYESGGAGVGALLARILRWRVLT